MDPMGYSILRFTTRQVLKLGFWYLCLKTWHGNTLRLPPTKMYWVWLGKLAQLIDWRSLRSTLQEEWDHYTYESTRYNGTHLSWMFGVCQSNVAPWWSWNLPNLQASGANPNLHRRRHGLSGVWRLPKHGVFYTKRWSNSMIGQLAYSDFIASR